MSGFRVSQQGVSVWWLAAALRRPQKKHAPGILEHASCGLEVEWIGKENEVDWIGVEERKGDW